MDKVIYNNGDKLKSHTLDQDLQGICMDVVRVELCYVQLRGFESSLFRKSFTFSDAPSQPPLIKECGALTDFTNFTHSQLLFIQSTFEQSAAVFLENVFPDDTVERLFLQMFLPTFLKMPNIGCRELYFKNTVGHCEKLSLPRQNLCN